MVRILYTIFIYGSLLLPVTAHSSPGLTKRVSFGAKIGVAVTDFGGADADRTDSANTVTSTIKLGMIIDSFAVVRLHRWIALQPELSILTKGSGTQVNGERGDTFRYTYLAAALLVQSGVDIRHRLRFVGVLGLSFGHPLSAGVGEYDLKDSTSTDISLAAGAGLTGALSTGSLLLDLRYEHGLRKVGEVLDLKHRAFLLMVGYQY